MTASKFATAAVALLSASQATAHMIMAYPVPFGDPDNSPLSSSGANFPCKLTGSPSTFYATSSTSSNNTMAIGETKQLSFTGSAVHGGGSCQLAITSDKQPSSSTTWQVIQSIEGGCPTTDGTGPSTYDFQIPASVAAGDYVFAWTWISKLAGQPEYYMNCAPITVTAAKSKRDQEVAERLAARASSLPNLFVANLDSINSCKTTPGTDPLFPDPGSNVVKPSKMTTNYQDVSGSNCFPIGGTSSGSNSSGSSGSSSAAASATAGSTAGSGSGSGSGAATGTASSGASTAATGSSSGSSTTNLGGVFATTSTVAADSGSATDTAGAGSATDTAGAASSTPAATSVAPSVTLASSAAPASSVSAAPSASGSTNGTTSGGMSGACTDEGTFNCVGGSQYQQCASGTWTALQAMPGGTTCKEGQSTTLWARDATTRRMRRVRRKY